MVDTSAGVRWKATRKINPDWEVKIKARNNTNVVNGKPEFFPVSAAVRHVFAAEQRCANLPVIQCMPYPTLTDGPALSTLPAEAWLAARA